MLPRSLLLLALAVPACSNSTSTDHQRYPHPRDNLGLPDPETGATPIGFFPIDLTLRPTFPDQTTLAATKTYVVVLRERISDTPCTKLWDTTAAYEREGGALVSVANGNMGRGISPASEGFLVVLLYAFDRELDLLCQTDEWCEESTSGLHCSVMPSGLQLCGPSVGAQPVLGWCEETRLTGASADLSFDEPRAPNM